MEVGGSIPPSLHSHGTRGSHFGSCTYMHCRTQRNSPGAAASLGPQVAPAVAEEARDCRAANGAQATWAWPCQAAAAPHYPHHPLRTPPLVLSPSVGGVHSKNACPDAAQCMHVIPRDPMVYRWLVVVVVAAASSQAAGADVCAKGVTSITDGGARPHSIPTHLKRHTQLFCHSAPPNKRANSTHMCRVVCVRSRPWTEFYSCVYSLLHHRVRPIAPAMCRASGCVCGLPPRRPHNKAKLLPKCDQAVGR